ncbi:MAG: relaxase/mobilization nuclease domain-containing protein [Legionella sp.]|nr:relaxase/mobilization nuclease domain-containing protein [Legionella sp.]
MIIRHIPKKSARMSSFSGLVKYITDEQNKQERVGKVRISNCNSIDPTWATQEVLATQAKNQRAKGDKTYHVLISFAPGENPSEAVLKSIEDRVISSIGLHDHQRISAIHHDTDNLHIHVAINKIHPKTFNMIEPYRAYKAFAEVASTLEHEFGLEVTNHQTRKGRSENLADDMERHSGIESLINWMKRNCKTQLDGAKDWATLHQVLAQHGIIMRVKANGFVFCNANGLTVKASSISRGFSKHSLESKLGAFTPATFDGEIQKHNVYRYEPLNKNVIGSALYARYQYDMTHGKATLSTKLKHLREAQFRLIEKTKKRARIKRSALKFMSASRTQKKYMYQHISKNLLNDIEAIREKYTTERKHLVDAHKNKTWADWLRQNAQEGDHEALTAMRYRHRKNQNNYTLSGTSTALTAFSLTNFEHVDSITKEGTEIYKFDKTVIKNNGEEIQISKGTSIAALKQAIDMAKQNYGNCIRVNGSPRFKKIILHIAVQNNITITFADPGMEAQRQKLILEQEKNNEQSRRYGRNDGRRTSRSHEVAGATATTRRGNRAKPNAFSVRQGAPAEGQNSLRDVPQLDVVQLAGRSEVLLQNHAHDKLERQRRQPDNHVRRKVFGLSSC